MEMLMVVTIMGIMLGAVIPNFRPFVEATTLKNTANTFSYMIRYARSIAIQRSVNVKLTLPGEGETGQVAFMVEPDPMNANGTFMEEQLPISYPEKLGDTIKIGQIMQNTLSGMQPTNEIAFDPQGMTSDTLITMTDPQERVYTIGIVGISGQVLIWDHEVSSFYEE